LKTGRSGPVRFVAGLTLSLVLALNGFCMAAQYCPMRSASVAAPVHEAHHACCKAEPAARADQHSRHCNGDCCKSCRILFHAASGLRSEKCLPFIPAQVLPEKICELFEPLISASPLCPKTESPPGLFIPIFAPLRI